MDAHIPKESESGFDDHLHSHDPPTESVPSHSDNLEMIREMDALKNRIRDLEFNMRAKLPSGAISLCTPSSFEKDLQPFQPPTIPILDHYPMKLPSAKLPILDGSNMKDFMGELQRWLNLTGVGNLNQQIQKDWLMQMATPKVKSLIEISVKHPNSTLSDIMRILIELFPSVESDMTLRASLKQMPALPSIPHPSDVAQLIIRMDEIFSRMSPHSISEQDKLLILINKVPHQYFLNMRQDRYYKPNTETYSDFKRVLMEKSKEDLLERSLFPTSTMSHVSGVPSSSQQVYPTQTHITGKGKGKGKGKPPASKPDPTTTPQPRFSATLFCKHCGKKGHYDTKCWVRFPELRPKSFPKRPAKPSPKPPPQIEKVPPSEQESKKRKADVLPSTTPVSKCQVNTSTRPFSSKRSLILKVKYDDITYDALIDTGAS